MSRRPFRPGSTAALIWSAVALGACGQLDEPRVERKAPCTGCGALADRALRGQVTSVADGDTVRVLLRSGDEERVRLLGIDAPEVSTTRTGRAECGGEQARDALVRLARRGREVHLVADPAIDARDRYGRLLAYVIPAGGGESWQETLLREGWAKLFVLRSQPIERLGAFRAAAAQARSDGAGVWSFCGGDFRRPR